MIRRDHDNRKSREKNQQHKKIDLTEKGEKNRLQQKLKTKKILTNL